MRKIILILSFFVFAGLLVFFYYNFNKAIVLDIPNSFSNDLNDSIKKTTKKAGLRDIKNKKFFYDNLLKKFYMKLSLQTIYLKEKEIPDNCIELIPFYITVDITSDLVRIKQKTEDLFFEYFKTNNENKMKFSKINELAMTRRVLLKEDNAEPIIFYKAIVFSINNCFKKRCCAIEEIIDFPVKFPSLVTILGFAGDVVIEEFVKNSIKKHGAEYTFRQVKDILETPDVMSVNLEFVVSNRGEKQPKRFTFRANEEQFRIITDSPIDYVSCANNHTMDYGQVALLDTIKYLDKHGIYHSGIGININKAFKPTNITKGSNFLSYFSICYVPTYNDGEDLMEVFKATKEEPGIAFYDKKRLSKLFKTEKEKRGINIIQYHTGQEYSFKPTKKHKYHAKQLIDMGADAVICHHPHVINGVEIYKGKIIAYSLGDFLFDIQKENADEGIVLFLFVKQNQILSWAFYPTFCHYGAVLIDRPRTNLVEKKFIELTKELN